MNLVTILIPFLLFSAQFVSLAVIDSTLPAIATTDPPDPEALDLAIHITADGYTVSADKPLPLDERTVARTQASMTPSAFDGDRLSEILGRIKDAWPDEDTVILEPTPDIPYEVLIYTMDVASGRSGDRELFPSVAIAGGST